MTAMPNPEPVLYGFARSPSWMRVALALHLKGIPHRKVMVDLLTGAQRSPAHLVRNPQGLLPVLEIDGLTLTQSLAIIDYLDETRPDVKLLPGDAAERARIRRFALAIAADVSPLCNLSISREVEERFGATAGRSWLIGNLSSGIAVAESLLPTDGPGPWCFGADPTLADCVLFSHVRAAWRWGIDTRGAPRVAAIYAHCRAQPAFADLVMAQADFN